MTTMTPYLTPVPVRRLVGTHLRIWRAQRGVVAGTAVALVVGLVGILITIVAAKGTLTAAVLGAHLVPATAGYTLLWLAVGAIAAAAPYRSGWAAVVLVVAPRRLRWLAASFASMLAWAVGTTAVLAAVSVAVGAGVLALTGQHPVVALGILGHLGPLVVATVLRTAVGFLLGAALRSLTAPLILGYVLAPATPLLVVHGVRLGHWLDLDAVIDALAAGRLGPSTVTALCLWVIAPALVATWRLRRSPVA